MTTFIYLNVFIIFHATKKKLHRTVIEENQREENTSTLPTPARNVIFISSQRNLRRR